MTRYLTLIFALFLLMGTPALAIERVTDHSGNQRLVNDRELACIGHAVVDPVAWVQHAADKNMLWAIDEKAAKWCPRYDEKKDRLGPEYRDRQERDAIEEMQREFE